MKRLGYTVFFIAAVIIGAIYLKKDFTPFITWWAALALCGLVFLPAGLSIFKSLADKGYLFSKALGILSAAYLLWLLSSIKLLPFGRLTSAICLAAIAIALFAIKNFRTDFIQFFKVPANRRLILLEESMFFICLLFWTVLRGLKPEIYGLEKYMDFGFVNSILRSTFAPPGDMWMAGSPINYYYFGQYITAFITSLTGIKPAIAYNLMMATLFAFAFALSFSLVFNIIRVFLPSAPKAQTAGGRKHSGKQTVRPGRNTAATMAATGGIVAALAVSLSGNLHGVIYSVIIPFLKKAGIYNGEVKNYWFPDATRYIGYNPPTSDKTIHEFPVYSFVVSDLHAHVINIIFVLTILAVLFAFFIKSYSIKASAVSRKWYMPETELIVAGFIIGTFHMSNFWDFPIYLTVTLILVFIVMLRNYGWTLKMLLYTLFRVAFVFLLSEVAALPFTMSFIKNVGGIKLAADHSPLYQLLVLWGCPLFFIVVFILYISFYDTSWKRHPVTSETEFELPVPRNKIKKKSRKIPFISSISKLADSILKLARKLHPADIFILVLGICAVGLVIAPEIVYVSDIYTGEYKRANTMFKLTYQSFIMFGLTIGYILVRLGFRDMRQHMNIDIKVIAIIIFASTMIYPIQAINSWYGAIKPDRYQRLDGLAYMQKKSPGSFAAINWLNDNVYGNPAILEADGMSYSDNCRISAATGLPTIVGWFTHEHLWRGNTDIVSEKANEVRLVYENGSLQESRRILEKYGIKYIIVGDIERDKFKALDENKLLAIGNIVFEADGTKIIEVK